MNETEENQYIDTKALDEAVVVDVLHEEGQHEDIPSNDHNIEEQISPKDINDTKAKTKGHHTPVRSKSPTLPANERDTKSSEKVRESWKTPEEQKQKSWSKPSAWSASKMDRFKEPKSKLETPTATKYNINLSSMENKEFNSIFKSTSPRFRDAKIETPPSTKYSIVDPNLSKKGDLCSTCFKTTTKREYELERKPKSPGPQYDPVILAIDTKKGIVSSFKSSVDRFKEPTPQTPPSTKYNVNSSTFQQKKDPTFSFGSTSPRFDSRKTSTPPSTKYDTNKYSDFNKPQTGSSSPFRSSSDRFFRYSEKAAKSIPPVGSYNVPSNIDDVVSRPSKK